MEKYTPEQVEEITKMMLAYASYTSIKSAIHSDIFGYDKGAAVQAQIAKEIYSQITPTQIQERIDQLTEEVKLKGLTKKVSKN